MTFAIVVVSFLVVAGALFAWWRQGQRRPPERADPGAAPSQLPTTRAVPRHDTALDELRGMREALKPAEHSRVERRRPGGSGSSPASDRRRGRGARAPQATSSGATASADDAER
jgi:hypothetical protein